MAKYTRDERIAIMVIEDQIWAYRNNITNRLLTTHPEMFKDIDSDDIGAINNRAAEIFKDITDTDIYTALGEAYGYNKMTIATKLSKHKGRVDTWTKYYNDPDKYYFDGTASLLNKNLAEYAYILQITEPYNTKIQKIISEGIIHHKINDELLSEDDIYAIRDIINKRSDDIYDGNPDSKVAPALTKFERYMIDYEKPEEEKKEDDIFEEKEEVFELSKDSTIKGCIDAFGRNHMEYTEIGFSHKGHKWKVIFFCEE